MPKPAPLVALVPAAGGGQRFGAPLPKQYMPLWQGKTVLECTLQRLYEGLRPDRMVVVLAADDTVFKTLTALPPGVEALYRGGTTRAESVRNGLAALASRCDARAWIAVHDAARPCVPHDRLAALAQWARDPVRENSSDSGALLALPLTDTLKEVVVDKAGTVHAKATHDRNRFWSAQTPQMFRFHLLCAALSQEEALDCTDEAQAIERYRAHASPQGSMPVQPVLLRGSIQNLKITYADDLPLAQALLDFQERALEQKGEMT